MSIKSNSSPLQAEESQSPRTKSKQKIMAHSSARHSSGAAICDVKGDEDTTSGGGGGGQFIPVAGSNLHSSYHGRAALGQLHSSWAALGQLHSSRAALGHSAPQQTGDTRISCTVMNNSHDDRKNSTSTVPQDHKTL